MDEYSNPAIVRLIKAATTQLELAMTVARFTRQQTAQSTVSRWLHTEGGVPVEVIPILIEVGRSLGVDLKPSDLRPDLAAVFASD